MSDIGLSVRRIIHCLNVGIALATAVAAQVASAAGSIKTDGSVGSAQTLAGPNYLIPQSLGTLSGNNLFHSFSAFNVGSGESATFTTITPSLANVIGRVTGGSASQINGLIQLVPAGGSPNFFFINPAGVTFGAGAAINVPAAFHVTTAQYLKFPDGNFYANPAQASTFSSAAPVAFGFLGNSRTAVTVNNAAFLSTPNAALQIVAGDVSIDNAAIENLSGDIRVVAVGNSISEIGLTGVASTAAGMVTLSNGGSISTLTGGATPAGNISISAGSIGVTNGSAVYSLSFSGASAGNISVLATRDLSIISASSIESDTLGSGNAGAVTVSAGSLLIDGQGLPAGISSNATWLGNSGLVIVSVGGQISLLNGGAIGTTATPLGNAGSITVSGGSLNIDGQGNAGTTGITSIGGGGDVRVAIDGGISILNGGIISSSANSSRSAGAVTVSSGSLNIDGRGIAGTGIASNASSSSGDSGDIQVAVGGQISLLNSGSISTATSSSGNAGSIVVSSGSLNVDGQGSGLTGIQSITLSTGYSGDLHVAVVDQISILNGGSISTATNSGAQAGNVGVSAGSINIDGQGNNSSFTGILSNAYLSTLGNAGDVNVVVAGQASIVNGGTVGSVSYGAGNGGAVSLLAGSLRIDGQGNSYTGIVNDPIVGNGNTGPVDVAVAGSVSVVNGGSINANTYTSANGGLISLTVGSLTIDGGSISSVAEPGSSGSAGNVQVSVTGQASILNGGSISSSTYSSGNAGSVNIAAGTLKVDGGGGFADVSSAAEGGSSGNAGSVQIAVVGQASIINGGLIRSTTSSAGNAGTVSVSASDLIVRGQSSAPSAIISEAFPGSIGNAGSVQVVVKGNVSILAGATISTDTSSTGNAGNLSLVAGSLTIDGQGGGGIVSSSANMGSTGDAGSVQVTVLGQTSIKNNGRISTNTASSGKAGSVVVSAGDLSIDGNGSGIFAGASADPGSSGQTGDVNVFASNSISLSNGGRISIENDATVSNPASIFPTSLSVSAPTITLTNAAISAASKGNVAASDISIRFGSELFLDPSFITTSAVNGNGGSIRVQGLGAVWLNDSEISTSVSGLFNGNGGDVSLAAQFLIMNGGFIQANTAAPLATGGNINITVNAIVPSGGLLSVGGSNPLVFNPSGFNVNAIQAAAPTGVSGNIEVSAPVLNATGTLVGLNNNVLSNAGLGRSPCSSSGGSSLAQAGRGGLPVSSSDLLRAELEDSRRSGASQDGLAPISERAPAMQLLATCR